MRLEINKIYHGFKVLQAEYVEEENLWDKKTFVDILIKYAEKEKSDKKILLIEQGRSIKKRKIAKY